MIMSNGKSIKEILANKGLKVTPQRIAVYDALMNVKNHPTVDSLIKYIRESHPSISVGTIYKTLETFVENKLVKRVKTEEDVMRYDIIIEDHHHIYCTKTGKIADYFDEDLDQLIKAYLKDNPIPGFELEEVKLSIIGNFNKLKINTNN